MAVSFEEFKQKRAQGLTIQQIKSEESSKPTEPGFIERAGTKIKERGQKIATEFKERPTSPTGLRNLETGVRTLGQIAGGVGDIAGEAISSTYKTVVPEIAQEQIKKTGVGLLRTEVGQSALRALEEGVDVYKKWAKANPNASKDIEAVVNIASILPVGKASQVVGKGALKAGELAVEAGVKGAKTAGKGIEKAGEFAAAQTFGLKPETVKNIIKNPELFTKNEIAKIDRESVFNKVKTAIEKRRQDLSSTGKEYESIKKLPNRTSVSEKGITEFLKNKGINVQDGKLKVNLESDIQLSPSDAKGLEEILVLVKGKTDLSAKEVLNLRTRLSNLASFGEGKTSASKLIAKELRGRIDEIAKKEIPGLKDLDLKFSGEKKLMDKVYGTIFKKDGSLQDNAISKIANLTGKGKEQALDRIEQIVPGIKKQVNILKSIEDIDAAGGQKVGTYFRTAIGAGGGLATAGPVGAILGAIATSPQVGVALLRSYGKLRGISSKNITNITNKMENGVKLIGEEKKIVSDALDNASKKIAERLKNIKPGMSIQETPNALQEAIRTTEKNIENLKAKGIKESNPQFQAILKELDRLRRQ